MQEKYTENIDELDNFYQQALQDAEVEPPAAMWDKISASYSEQKKPKNFFTRKRNLLLLLLLLSFSAGLFLFLTKNKSEKTITPEDTKQIKTEVEAENKLEENSNKETETTKAKKNNSSRETKNNDQQENSGTSKELESQTNSTTIETKAPESTIAVPVVEAPKAKPDSITTPKEAPKKKMSFREKHTQNIKADSLRPLFIPVK